MSNGIEPTIEELRAFTGDDGLPSEFWDRQMYYVVGHVDDVYCAECISGALEQVDVTELDVKPEFLYPGEACVCEVCGQELRHVA